MKKHLNLATDIVLQNKTIVLFKRTILDKKRYFLAYFSKNTVTFLRIFLSMIVEADKFMNQKESYHGKEDLMF